MSERGKGTPGNSEQQRGQILYYYHFQKGIVHDPTSDRTLVSPSRGGRLVPSSDNKLVAICPCWKLWYTVGSMHWTTLVDVLVLLINEIWRFLANSCRLISDHVKIHELNRS